MFQRINRAVALFIAAGFFQAVAEDVWTLIKDLVAPLF